MRTIALVLRSFCIIYVLLAGTVLALEIETQEDTTFNVVKDCKTYKNAVPIKGDEGNIVSYEDNTICSVVVKTSRPGAVINCGSGSKPTTQKCYSDPGAGCYVANNALTPEQAAIATTSYDKCRAYYIVMRDVSTEYPTTAQKTQSAMLTVHGTVYAAPGDRPLKNVHVAFMWSYADSSDYTTYATLKDGYTDNDGKYSFDAYKPNFGKGYLKVELKDGDSIFFVTDMKRDINPSDITSITDGAVNFVNTWNPKPSWYPFGTKGLNSFVVLGNSTYDLQLDGFFSLDKQGSTDKMEMHAPHNANIYINTKMAAEIYDSMGTLSNKKSAIPIVSFLDHKSSYFRGDPRPHIMIKRNDSIAAVTDRYVYRQNVEWHEFTHYLEYLAGIPSGKRSCSNSLNHGGYLNGCSDDSVGEGLAEFMGQVIFNEKILLPEGKPKSPIYFGSDRGGSFGSLDWIYPVTADEEFAFAGILWKLYNPRNATLKDDFEMPYRDIWNLLAAKYPQPVYYGNGTYTFPMWPQTLDNVTEGATSFGDLMTKLRSTTNAGTTEKVKTSERPVTYFTDLYYLLRFQPGNSAKDANALFVPRRVFLDCSAPAYAGTKLHTDNLIPGIADPHCHLRRDYPFSHGSIVTITSLKESLPYIVTVHVKFDAPYEYMNVDFGLNITDEVQDVYVGLPTSDYNATYYITGSKAGGAEKPVFNITSQEYEKNRGPFSAQAPVLQAGAQAPVLQAGEQNYTGLIVLVAVAIAVASGYFATRHFR